MSEKEDVDTKSESPSTSTSNFVPGAHLYTDFSSDTIPTPVQALQTEMIPVSQTPKEAPNKDEKSTEERPKKPNRKDWIDTDNPFHCKPCDFTAQNIEEFQDHSLSYKHIKKTAEVLEMRVNSKKVEEKKKPVSFNCEVCVCSCNSESAWNSHLVGQKHRKNLEKQGAAKMFQKQKMKYGSFDAGGGPVFHNTTQLTHKHKPYQKPAHSTTYPYSLPSPAVHCVNDFAQYKEPLIGLEYVTEIQVTGQNPRYHCKLCDAKFDHNVKFPHLVGAKHRFNVLKEKNPAIAQEIRVGVKKRSELTGKLLEEAMKIEQQEGRQQVKTCVEASPFETATSNTPIQRGFTVEENFSHPGRGRGRGFSAQSRPYQKSPRGHPLKGAGPNAGRGGQKRASHPMNYQNQFSSNSGFGSNNQGYSSNETGFGSGSQYQGGATRGRGGGNGRGRGRGGFNQGYGRGFNNNKQNKQTSSFTSTGPYQQRNSGFNTANQFKQSNTGTLLPKEAFAPRSPPRSQYNYSNPNFMPVGSRDGPQKLLNQQYGQTGMQANNQSALPVLPPLSTPDAQSTNTPPAQPASTSTDSSAQNLLKGLTDLGKLVSSEEDASIALQVSNALTQALLQYRMQGLQEEGQ